MAAPADSHSLRAAPEVPGECFKVSKACRQVMRCEHRAQALADVLQLNVLHAQRLSAGTGMRRTLALLLI